MKGPTKVVIPEQRFLSCRECEFYNYTMLKSGLSPIYGHFCSNPDIPEDKKRLSPLNWNGNLMDDKTPDWCPLPDYDEDDDIYIPICNHCRTNEFVTVLPDGNKHCNKCGSNWI